MQITHVIQNRLSNSVPHGYKLVVDKDLDEGWRDVQQLRAPDVLVEDTDSVLNTHRGQLTTTCNSSS